MRWYGFKTTLKFDLKDKVLLTIQSDTMKMVQIGYSGEFNVAKKKAYSDLHV